MFGFTKHNSDPVMRRGTITTWHGEIETPAFVPVGTQATVKGMSPELLKQTDTQVVFANTYHLYLRPGEKIIKDHGGLHKFMQWDRPIMTDSGGFQAFSLGFGIEHGVGKIGNIFPDEDAKQRGYTEDKKSPKKLCTITEDGVEFRSHLDGKKLVLTPENSMRIQSDLGADMIMAFDECTSPLSSKEYTAEALQRTHRWAKRSQQAHSNDKQALFGIVQGGAYEDLRMESVKAITDLEFPGYAVGGSLGNTKRDMYDILEWVVPSLPDDKPRHLLGIGTPEDIIEGVKRGMDTFDCVAPTREARNGVLYILKEFDAAKLLASPKETKADQVYERITITNGAHTDDKSPISESCTCYACANFSRAYLNHLYRAKEILGLQLGTIHNIHTMNELMRRIREALT